MQNQSIYEHIYHDTRSMIMALSGFSDSELDDRATELGLHYDFFLADYSGALLVDAYLGFAEMMRTWSSPWPPNQDSGLNGLTFAQFFLVWAWEQNRLAMTCLGPQFLSDERDLPQAMGYVLNAAVSAQRALGHAKLLLAAAEDKLAQSPLTWG